jgi:hypothetical protein
MSNLNKELTHKAWLETLIYLKKGDLISSPLVLGVSLTTFCICQCILDPEPSRLQCLEG